MALVFEQRRCSSQHGLVSVSVCPSSAAAPDGFPVALGWSKASLVWPARCALSPRWSCSWAAPGLESSTLLLSGERFSCPMVRRLRAGERVGSLFGMRIGRCLGVFSPGCLLRSRLPVCFKAVPRRASSALPAAPECSGLRFCKLLCLFPR